METKRKVFAYITRGSDDQRELLVFEYQGEPEVGVQVPGGSIAEGELLIDALYREVQEETGLTKDELQFMGKVQKYNYYPAHKDKVYERNIFHFEYIGEPRSHWVHTIESNGRDNGMTLEFRWEPLSDLPTLAAEQDKAVELLEY